MLKTGIVGCKLPKAGLGNQLFPLLKAFVFGSLNELPVMVTGNHKLKVGPWLRGEKTKRRYSGFFYFQENMLADFFSRAQLFFTPVELVVEPPVGRVTDRAGKCFSFSKMPHWENYFEGLKEHRQTVKELFIKLTRSEITQKVNGLPSPIIGVHIRMGDFRKLKEGEDFSKVGAVRTPETYFIDVINKVRAIHGAALPVTIFTDGHKAELSNLLELHPIEISEGNNDLEDLLLLSKSKLIITSAGSTFSYWSAFLSDAPVIMHPAHLHQPLRPDDVNECWYEGPFEETNGLLQQNISAIEYWPVGKT